MEPLTLGRNQPTIVDPGARTLRGIIIVSAIVLTVGIALSAIAPRREAGFADAPDRTLQDGARPQPGRRY